MSEYKCWKCGSTGHATRECEADSVRPRSTRDRWQPPPPPANRHAYPDDHYLLHECPFCKRGPMQLCFNVGTGRERPPHPSRVDLVPAPVDTLEPQQ